jgi:hypothetical protein
VILETQQPLAPRLAVLDPAQIRSLEKTRIATLQLIARHPLSLPISAILPHGLRGFQ